MFSPASWPADTQARSDPLSSHDGREALSSGFSLPGHHRPTDVHPVAGLLERVLDEVDYGVVILSSLLRVVHANRAAQLQCESSDSPCRLVAGQLHIIDPIAKAAFEKAVLGAAVQAKRHLVPLRGGAQSLQLAVVPLSQDWGGVRIPPQRCVDLAGRDAVAGGPEVLVLFSRRQACETLSIEFYARAHGLTHAETGVLSGLCRGVPPNRIAADAGVAVSTVRTQVSSIRQKTGTASIGDLVRQVAMLPPIVPSRACRTAH